MKLVTYQDQSGEQRLGAFFDNDEQIADLARAHESISGSANGPLGSMQALIEAGENGLELAYRALEHAQNEAGGEFSVPGDSVRLLSPLPVPVQMRDFLCFETHLKQSFQSALELQSMMADDPSSAMEELKASGRFNVPEVWYQFPIYYKCNRFACIGTGDDILWPRGANLLDYELELAAIIGHGGKDIAAEDAEKHIFGYTIFNDISARDVQTVEMQGMLGPAKGKDFDTSNILGPCIVTADEIDPYDLTMVARVNGEEWSRGQSGTMHHKFGACIEHVSRSETLYPGEILGSGTVGNGCGLELKRFLSPGDVIELEIEGIGILKNRLTKPE